jgi:hypothetical protein
MSKITKTKVAKIKLDLSNGVTQPAAAKKHKVSRSLVSDIATGRVHKDVPWPDGEAPVKKAGGQRRATPQYDPNDDRIKDLEAEVLHLREERDHARKQARLSAKERGIYKAVVKEMENRVHPFKALPPAREIKPRKAAIEEHVVMHLSDGHHDQIVSREESGGLEEYNFPISCRRAETYVDTLLDWTQETLSPKFNFKVCTVLAYGDHTSGEIHGHVSRSYFRNQFKNCFAIAQLHALMYRDLAPHYDAVNVVYLPGNHGRRSTKKDYHGAHDNWDYLIAEMARLHCRDIENISFLIPNAFSVNVDINGVGFNLSHGDDVQGSLGIPFYGMVRRQKGLIALNSMAGGGQRIRYFCMGHHHVQGALADIDGELVLNGAWVGTDSYAFNRFSGYREPSQLIHGVNPKHGITWRMNVHLRTQDEAKGPQRYKIDL